MELFGISPVCTYEDDKKEANALTNDRFVCSNKNRNEMSWSYFAAMSSKSIFYPLKSTISVYCLLRE
jgi:hypothetical protein